MSIKARSNLAPLVVLAMLAAALTGCGGPPKVNTPFLRSVDLMDMTDQMAHSFAADPVIGARTTDDEPWVISIYRVVNHTNQIIPEREKWLYVGRLRTLLVASQIAVDRRIIWVIPPERWSIVEAELGLTEPRELRMPPTHLLTATFDALTNTSGQGRSDTYLCAYELVDLQSGKVIWLDSWEVKRAVQGITYD